MNTQQFFRYLKGRTVAFCGVGRTHMPLIKLFQEKGAVVTVRDQRPWRSWGRMGRSCGPWGWSSAWVRIIYRTLTRTSSSAHQG